MLTLAIYLLSLIADIIFVFFTKKNLDSCLKSITAKKLFINLQKLLNICQQNFHHTYKLQKQANNKEVKPQNYAPGNKIWLSNKYFKTKQNCKLKAKFFFFKFYIY